MNDSNHTSHDGVKSVKLIPYDALELRAPYLISGLPSIGYVAKLTADYLKTQLNATLFEEIYSPAFPPYVTIKEDGTVELLKNELYFWKNVKSQHDLIIFTGNTQAVTPEGQFTIVDEVLHRAERLDVRRIVSIAAFVCNERPEAPRVFGVVTNPELTGDLKKLGIVPMDSGSIAGTNGLLFGYAQLRGIQGVCLLGETSAHATPSGQVVIDAVGAKAVLEVLTRMLDIEVDMDPLEKQAQMTEDLVSKMEGMRRRAIQELQRADDREVPRYYV